MYGFSHTSHATYLTTSTAQASYLYFQVFWELKSFVKLSGLTVIAKFKSSEHTRFFHAECINSCIPGVIPTVFEKQALERLEALAEKTSNISSTMPFKYLYKTIFKKWTTSFC